MNEPMGKNCCKTTFTIQIQFQQHSSWQGTIAWAEGEKSQKFRSELELLKLMMEAVASDKDEAEEMLCTWQ